MGVEVCQYCGEKRFADETHCSKCGRRLGPEPASSDKSPRARGTMRVRFVVGVEIVRRLFGFVLILGALFFWYRLLVVINWNVIGFVETNPFWAGLLVVVTAIVFWVGR